MKNLYLLAFLSFTAIIASAQWSLTGNTGTVAGPNYIGTNDLAGFMIKVNKKRSGYIHYTDANTSFGFTALTKATNKTNVAFGYKSLFSTVAGGYNTAVGNYSLYSNINSSYNTAIGYEALYHVDSAGLNTATGYQALYSSVNGVANTATGYQALYASVNGAANTAMGYRALMLDTIGYNNTGTGYYTLLTNNGNNNTANGAWALYSNSSGNYNAAMGSLALYSNQTGNNNTANGSYALYFNTAGYSNVAMGVNALFKNKDCHNLVAVGDSALYNISFDSGGYYSNNTAIGSKALYANTTGHYNTATGFQALTTNESGYNNTATGVQSLWNNSTGYNNTAMGNSALSNNSAGNGNTAVGTVALVSNSFGFSNTAVGYYSMVGNVSGDNNTCIGANTNVGIGMLGLHGAAAIGANAIVNANNKMQLGSSTTTLSTSGGYTIVSDGRFKEDVKDNEVSGLEFINKLHPVTYYFNYKRFDEFVRNDNKNDAVKKVNAVYVKELEEKSKQRQDGFIAQEVAKVCADNKIVFSGIYTPQNSSDNYALDYSRFVVPLVKAVQELSKMNNEKDARLDAQQKINAELQNQINALKAMMASGGSAVTGRQAVSISSASLQQNVPNPFNNTTTINYALPQQYSLAKIIITDESGKQLKEINISNGKNTVLVDASTLSHGAYNYSLYVDGKLIDTKQMIH
jgi:hypothetical protein